MQITELFTFKFYSEICIDCRVILEDTLVSKFGSPKRAGKKFEEEIKVIIDNGNFFAHYRLNKTEKEPFETERRDEKKAIESVFLLSNILSGLGTLDVINVQNDDMHKK